MSDETVYEIPLDLTNDSGGEVTSVTIRISVSDGNITNIEAVNGDKSYVGKLILHELSEIPTEGGDQCIICNPVCHVVSPCPDGFSAE